MIANKRRRGANQSKYHPDLKIVTDKIPVTWKIRTF